MRTTRFSAAASPVPASQWVASIPTPVMPLWARSQLVRAPTLISCSAAAMSNAAKLWPAPRPQLLAATKSADAEVRQRAKALIARFDPARGVVYAVAHKAAKGARVVAVSPDGIVTGVGLPDIPAPDARKGASSPRLMLVLAVRPEQR